jgi:uncharacterized RDD family membrane protein YckC
MSARFGAGTPAGYCEFVADERQAAQPPTARNGGAGQSGYPGSGFGFPAAGSGAISGMGRRVGALFIDWILSALIVAALIRPPYWEAQYWTLAIFAAQDLVLTALTGVTIGKRLLRIRVARLDGRMVGGWALVRTVLLLCVIPPLILDRDLRGLHDRASNTAVVRI